MHRDNQKTTKPYYSKHRTKGDLPKNIVFEPKKLQKQKVKISSKNYLDVGIDL